MSADRWPSNRACGVCGTAFFPRSTVQLYCSAACRDRTKYDRVRNNPELWNAYLAKEREKYQPKERRPSVVCSADGCDGKHLARGLCRTHYRRDRYRRGLDRGYSVEIVSALVKHYSAGEFTEPPTSRRLIARVVGDLLIPECPDCGGTMMKLPDEDMDLRDCASCGVRALLNSEEVSWLASGKASTAR